MHPGDEEPRGHHFTEEASRIRTGGVRDESETNPADPRMTPCEPSEALPDSPPQRSLCAGNHSGERAASLKLKRRLAQESRGHF
ncbi:hypothetical protein E5288_WYG017879 [Bos mutus]|uniref:Uncharacterized protein n=1 Tax=Bos mutus TaxID=72004 RepID=A0A6B0SD95_9CETA|nr:hypothetical protein [Bos mutus]